MSDLLNQNFDPKVAEETVRILAVIGPVMTVDEARELMRKDKHPNPETGKSYLTLITLDEALKDFSKEK